MLKTKTNLTKLNIAKKINSEVGLSVSFSSKFIDKTISIFINTLKKNEIVKIPRLGTFKILHKIQRTGRNPRTKEIHVIKKRKALSFSQSDFLKKIINK
jgi:integration host factor subunit alpha